MEGKEQRQEAPHRLCWAAHGRDPVPTVTSGADEWPGHPAGAFGEVKETEIGVTVSAKARVQQGHGDSSSLGPIHHTR